VSDVLRTRIARGESPQTRYEALLARDDAKRIAEKFGCEGGETKRRAAELLEMLHDLLVEQLARPDAIEQTTLYCAECSGEFSPDEEPVGDEAEP
jgi:hypothetical protein